ncbi:PLP-dependent aminotransferase family protein [Pseudomonas sp. R5(2019)]|uniref:aminotransferase-like domain-containing protein n=1 Tax=Pseudomonas sp. R5(2019) TaxID=2697566 RepID=UPI001413515D|nr:PLP-dependent aminotransferase family protein [Pseudomonas sp. R5(2019)]NBA98310.1 aminotransferase class I/II-fold pyridoxal phosphate-dependent enzyme [Pseudomonas sp. R5(2019)]
MSNDKSGFAYQAVYQYLTTLIGQPPDGTPQKLPSLRHLAQRLGVSISTIQTAYSLLENEGRVYSVPKSGYFASELPETEASEREHDLLHRMHLQANRPDMLVLSRGEPSSLISLEGPLLTVERELMRQYPSKPGRSRQPCGELELRTALAARYTCSAERHWCADDVYIGADVRAVLETLCAAMELAGSAVLVASPCSWLVLQTLQAAGLRVIELPLCAAGTLDLQVFGQLLSEEPVALVLLCSRVSSPHGSLMPEADRRAIAELLALHGVWLLENDLDGEFCFAEHPGERLRELVDPQRLLVFSSLEKIIGAEAPYGFLLSRHFRSQLQRHFLQRSFRLPPIRQRAIARLFRKGLVDPHLHQLRRLLQTRLHGFGQQLREQAGDYLTISPPQGGSTLWAQLTHPTDPRRLFERLLQHKIVVAPGEIFSLQGWHQQCLRLGFPLDDRQDVQAALKSLAEALRQARL